MIASDFDRTLVGQDALLHPRTRDALRAASAAGLRVVVVTGRMFRSVRPYLLEAELHDPVICYQGAVVADPVSGDWLRHEPIPLELAKEAIAAVEQAGYPLNCYVDDELYVAEETEWSRRYAEFQNLPVTAVGELLQWIEKPPTKLVAVEAPEVLDRFEVEMKAHFGDRLYISKSLPYFLEFASPLVTKASGLEFLAEHLGFTVAERERVRRRGERRRARRVGRLRRRGRERAPARARGRRLGLPAGRRGRCGAGD